MSEDAATNRERFEDASHVLHGPAGSTAWRQLLYVLYVVAIFASLYGFTVARGVVEVFGPRWRAAGATAPAAAGGLVLLAVLLVLAHLAGRRRGPVTPEPAWIDHVVASSIDRALTLRESWLVPGLTLLGVGGLLGGVLGAALFGGGATGPVAIAVGLACGLLGGAGLATSWLSGQVHADPARRSAASVPAVLLEALRSPTALRGLGAEGLRSHSLRAARMGGAVLSADARALRLEVAAPVRRGRHLHLRPIGRMRTVLARDLLGLRRQPLLPVAGVALAVPGALALGWVVAGEAPGAVAALAVLLLQLGATVVAEGLRLHGDTLGTPPLLGGSARALALAHTGAPALLLLAVAGPVAVTTAAVLGGAAAAVTAALAVPASGAAVLAGLWSASFRGQPPIQAFGPDGGPSLLLAWWAWPRILSVAGAALVLAQVARFDSGAGAAPSLVVVLVPALLAWLARSALDRAAGAHRG